MFVCFFNDFFNEQRLRAGMFLKVMILDTSALSTKQLMFEMQKGTKFTLSFLQHSYLSSGFIFFLQKTYTVKITGLKWNQFWSILSELLRVTLP